MIAGFVRGQTLRLSVPLIAADTIDYLTAKFLFQSADWDELEKWVHFAKDGVAYDIRLVDDQITEDAHLNLSAGEWTVYLHGNRYADGSVVQRITTNQATLEVSPTGILSGEPFPTVPPSAGEQIVAAAVAAETGAKEAAEDAGQSKASAEKHAEDAGQSKASAEKHAEDAGLSAKAAAQSEENAASSAEEARKAADEAAQYEPEVFWAEYGVTPYADVAAAFDAGKICAVRYLSMRYIAVRSALAAERFIEFTGTTNNNEHCMIRVTESDQWSVFDVKLISELDRTFTVSETSKGDLVPTDKAVYDAIKKYGGTSSGGAAGVVVYAALYMDGQVQELDAPVVYPEGADAAELLAAGQARMIVMAPPADGGDMPVKLGVLELCSMSVPEYNFWGTITGTDGNEAVMVVLNAETGALSIMPMVQNSAGSGASGGGIVKITKNDDGTYSSSHTGEEIAAMAKTGAVSAEIVGALGVPTLIPVYMYADNGAIFRKTYIDDDIVYNKNIVDINITVLGSEVQVTTVKLGNMTAPHSGGGGDNGFVPAPAEGQQDYVLHGDGTWREVELPDGSGLTSETAIADDDTVPFYDTSAKAQRKTLWSNIKAVLKTYFDGVYLKLSGGTLSGKIVFPYANQNVGFVNSNDVKIFGYGNIDSVTHMRMGDSGFPLQLRGKDNAPKYNDDTLVLQSAFETALGAYITDIDALIGGDE